MCRIELSVINFKEAYVNWALFVTFFLLRLEFIITEYQRNRNNYVFYNTVFGVLIESSLLWVFSVSRTGDSFI